MILIPNQQPKLMISQPPSASRQIISIFIILFHGVSFTVLLKDWIFCQNLFIMI